jgi:hypothetical protein
MNNYETVLPNLPPPPFGSGISMPSNSMDSSTIAGMRWNGDQLILQLYKLLGDYDVKVDTNGQYTFERLGTVRPRINDEGLQAIMSIIQSNVNASVSLSNITNDDANTLVRQTCIAVAVELTYNQYEWGITDSNKSIIMSVIKSIVFNQQKRAVEGHESQNYRTQTFEQNVQQQYTQNQPNNGGFLASFKPNFLQGGRR